MDFMVELPEVNGFNALLVIVNKLGKLLCLLPCRAGEGQLTVLEVVKLFFENWVGFFGIPKVVLHDCDAHFTAAFGKCCRVSWVRELFLVALTILKPMVGHSAKIILLNR